MNPIKARIMANTDKRTHTLTDGRISVSSGSPEAKFVQALAGAGYDLDRTLEIRRNGTLVYEPMTLGDWVAVKTKSTAPETAQDGD